MVTNYISDKAKIGENTKIWHFVYVGDDVEIGNNVKIGSLSHIDYDVKIGDDTLIEGLVYIPPLSRIGKNVFIGPSAALTNDPYPPSDKLAGVIIEDNAIIGSKAVIKAGVTIGKNSIIGAGAVVTKDVPANSIYAGNPAVLVKKLTEKSFNTRKEFFSNPRKLAYEFDMLDKHTLKNNSFINWIKSKIKPDIAANKIAIDTNSELPGCANLLQTAKVIKAITATGPTASVLDVPNTE